MGRVRRLSTTPTTCPLLPTHGRFPYSAIERRPDYSWPGGKRLAVYFAINLEHFSFGSGMGAKLGAAAVGNAPDVLNWSWREYGNRVGSWRMLRLFEGLGLPTTVLVNTAIFDHCPEVVEAYLERGSELVAHGHTNSEAQGALSVEDERELIARVTDAIARRGRRPRGWLGPWISQSARTPDLLREAGYDYLLDWAHDDQPTKFITTPTTAPSTSEPTVTTILSIPYQQELNDIPHAMARLGGSREFADDLVDGFDELLAQSVQQPLVLGVALHPYIVGQPHRLRQLRRALQHIKREADTTDRVWFCQPGEIAEYCGALPTGVVV